jgi:outer membrane protein OmpA-like peptidoglycan-associated protein
VPNEPGTFTATINDDATRPVELEWNFGDGSTAPGLTATHSYTRAGSYTVTFTASNRGSSDTAQCNVSVIGPAEIVGITANPAALDACVPLTPVNFTSNVRGSAPIEYRWDFGDGGTSTEPNPSHTYENPGTYSATLTVSNQAGSDSRSLTVTVEPCFCEEVEEMNSVFFDRNSSVLTEQARQALQENLQILLDCETVCVRIEGYASRDERNPQQLSEDRARAVMQYYAEGGVRTSRMRALGLGAQGTLGKEGGAPQFRRVDTIPVPCVELDQLPTPGQGNDQRP